MKQTLCCAVGSLLLVVAGCDSKKAAPPANAKPAVTAPTPTPAPAPAPVPTPAADPAPAPAANAATLTIGAVTLRFEDQAPTGQRPEGVMITIAADGVVRAEGYEDGKEHKEELGKVTADGRFFDAKGALVATLAADGAVTFAQMPQATGMVITADAKALHNGEPKIGWTKEGHVDLDGVHSRDAVPESLRRTAMFVLAAGTSSPGQAAPAPN